MAMAAITEGLLAEGHTVKVLCMATHRHPFSEENVPSAVQKSTRMEAVHVDVRVKPLDAFLNLFSASSYNLIRFNDNSFRAQIEVLVKEGDFDLVHLESLFCAPYIDTIRAHSSAKVVLRAHNVEHVIWQRLAQHSSNPVKRAYLNLLADRLKREEIPLLQQMDGIATITEDDLSALTNLGVTVPMRTVPMALDMRSILPRPLTGGPIGLYHLASMDWQPNVEAVEYFIREIWPLIHREMPEVAVRLAGRNMPQHLLSRSAPPLYVMGEVPSAAAFAEESQVMVAPLISGSGMRIKIVEAMALGKVVLSTTIGAEGIACTDGRDILIADTPSEFVAKLKWLREHPEMMQRIGSAARQLAETQFGLEQVTKRLTDFYREVG